eukprot:COSAG05_NODE_534_length_8874_cov_19.159544_6_plen_201_part_00
MTFALALALALTCCCGCCLCCCSQRAVHHVVLTNAAPAPTSPTTCGAARVATALSFCSHSASHLGNLSDGRLPVRDAVTAHVEQEVPRAWHWWGQSLRFLQFGEGTRDEECAGLDVVPAPLDRYNLTALFASICRMYGKSQSLQDVYHRSDVTETYMVHTCMGWVAQPHPVPCVRHGVPTWPDFKQPAAVLTIPAAAQRR